VGGTHSWRDNLVALLTPRRRRGIEYLDDPAVDARVVRRSLDDVARSNALFGGTRAVLAELQLALRDIQRPIVTLLDVGTGAGDIPSRARAVAARMGIELVTIGIDGCEALARAAKSASLPMVRATALSLPVADHSVDIALCSQVLHHFEHQDAIALLRELNRVARHRVIVSDLRRSWLAAAGIWLASFPLRFHPVSRHDGVVSVLRGFTGDELRHLVRAAVHQTPSVRNHLGFRTTAAWTPGEAYR
jgi:2-polyprenyl-3-methyl-5-hydroxy-6-metoxy-1,4-benzoquinol methylase